MQPELALPLGIGLLVLLFGSYGLGLFVRRQVRNTEDFLVAGRRLPLPLATATLLATWFGAGTMLTAADEIRHGGLQMAALEPVGAGLCLVIAGAFFARRLWDMRLLTFSDFFARRFGPRAEVVSAIVMIPGYFGWIAVQFIALSSVLEVSLGLPLNVGIALVALVALGYTLLGGMWAVTITDAFQVVLLLAGLVILAVAVIGQLGDGPMGAFARLQHELPREMLEPIPTESRGALLGFIAVLAVAALGNLPGQDLMQRIFAARSSSVARTACFLAGGAYLLFGSVPVLLGLAARVLVPDVERAIVPAIAQDLLTPALAVVFTLALAAAVLSTIDSAILSPSSVLAQNLLSKVLPKVDPLRRNRHAVVAVTVVSLVVAYVGEDAYSLLEGAYEIGLVGLFVPLVMGLYRKPRSELPALTSMAAGSLVWLGHLLLGWEAFLAPWLGALELPVSLCAAAVGLVAYLASDR